MEYGRYVVDPTVTWEESQRHYPGRSRLTPERVIRSDAKSEKSAEAVVVCCKADEGPNQREDRSD